MIKNIEELNKMPLSDKTHSVIAVYKITNLIDGKIYVGGTTNYCSRVSVHISNAKSGLPSKSKLVSAFLKHGFDNFKFEIIELIEPDKDLLLERERFWIKELCSCEDNIGYNKVKIPTKTRGGVGGPVRTIKILSATHPKLRMVAAMTMESMIDVIERLLDNEMRRLKLVYKETTGENP